MSGTPKLMTELARCGNLPLSIADSDIRLVVLSSQAVGLEDALYNAGKDGGRAQTFNPLVQDGQKLVPCVTRVFSRSKDMHVYLQAYQQGEERLT